MAVAFLPFLSSSSRLTTTPTPRGQRLTVTGGRSLVDAAQALHSSHHHPSLKVIDNSDCCASMDDGPAVMVCSKQHSLPCSAEICRDERTQCASVESPVVPVRAHRPSPARRPYAPLPIRCCSCRIDGVASLHGSHHTTTSAIAEVLIYQAFAHLAVTPGVLTKLLCHKWQRSARPWFRHFPGP